MELVHAANILLSNGNIDGVITLGCIIKGETDHDKYIASAVANGLVSVSLKYNKPVIFGVLTTNTLTQALDRCGGKRGNKGAETADTLLSVLDFS